MNILICDDIRDEALKLENAVMEASRTSRFKADLVYFNNTQDVLKFIKTGAAIDVCFLDIIMPEMNGIELAKKMRDANFNGKIVFLTSSNDYGVESYQVKAYFYLLKPVNKEDVKRLLDEIQNDSLNNNSAQLKQRSQQKQRAGIKVETRNMTRIIYFHEISFVEVINKNVFFRLLDGSEIVMFSSLNDILQQLTSDGRFVQCHRSFVVNMDAITHIHGKDIFLRCGRKTIISRSYKEFSNLYLKYIFADDKQTFGK